MPAEQTRTELPPDVRGNHFRSMDRRFTAVLAVSFVVHSGIYVALARTDVPAREPTLEEIPDRYARLLVPERLARPPERERKPERKAEAPVERDRKERPEQAEERKPESAEQVAQRKAARAAAVARAVQSKGLLRVLGTLGAGGAGGPAVAAVFGEGAAMGDVASALSGAGGVALATDPGAGAGRKGGRQGGTASIGELATSGGGKVALGAKAVAKVAGSVAAEDAEVDSSEVDQGKLAAFVRARMGLVKACYESALKRNPGLKGKIVIRFTILATGALADVVAAQDTVGSGEVGACIVSTMRSWRTQFRPSGPATVEYPFVFQPVN